MMEEEELEGYIIMVNDDSKSGSPASVRFQPQSFSSPIVLLYREHAWTHFYKHRLKLIGHFMHSTLRGIKLFEVVNVSVLSIDDDHDDSNFKVPSLIQGRVSSISQCLKLKNGPTVFVTLSKLKNSEEIDSLRILLLSKSAIQCASFIYEGCILTLKNPQRFKWKSDSEETDKIPECNNASNIVHYSVEDANYLSVSVESSIDQNAADRCKGASAAGVSAEALVAPLTLLDKETLAGTEFCMLAGRVQSVHTTGWLELRNVELSLCGTRWSSCTGSSTSEPSQHSSGGDSCTEIDIPNSSISLSSCVVYLSHHCLQHLRLTALGVSVRHGAVVVIRRIIPVYLWGNLKGFATSCRSSIGITEFSQSKKFVSREPNYCAVTAKIPAEMRASCAVYTAWRVEFERKVTQALGPSLRKHLYSEEQLIASVEALATYTDVVSGRYALSLREVMQLAPCAIQDELFDLHRVLLYSIRNGYDADWLSNQLPQLHTSSHFVNKLRYLQGQQECVGSAAEDPVVAMRWHDPCTVPTFSHFWAQHSGRDPSQSKGGNSSNSSGRAAARKNITVVGVVTEVRLPRNPPLPWQWFGNREIHPSLSGSVLLKVKDSLGCALDAWVDGITEQFYCELVARCRRCQCLCAQCCQPTADSESLRIILNTGCLRGASGASGIKEPLVTVLHKPFGLVEQQPSLAGRQEGRVRYFAQCTAADVSLIGGDADPLWLAAQGQQKCSPGTPKLGEVLEIRELLCLNLGAAQQKLITAVQGVVTHILLLEVEFKKDGDRVLDAAAQDSHKRRKLEPFEQQQQPWSSGAVNVADAKKCSVTLRDTRYPDSINVYLPFSRLMDVGVGCVVLLRDTCLCVPESMKKLYLKPADPNKINIDAVGRARGWQLQRLSELSTALPDPRFLDTTALQCGVGLGGGAGEEGPGMAMTGSGAVVTLRERNFLRHPPRITLCQLSQQMRHSRALWAVQCQVVFVRKLSVTLRCSKCKAAAKTAPGKLCFQCSKCSSQFTLQPLWEAQLALDDGTAECTANVEGDGVLFLLRARFDDKGLVLQEVRTAVEEHVAVHGSIIYDAFERQEYSDAKTRPYAAPVSVEGVGAGAAAELTEGVVFEGPSQNAVFDLPLSEKLKVLTPRFPLKERPASIKASAVLRAYLQVGCFAHHFATICRVDFSATALKLAAPATGGSGKLGKREIKLQKNNQEKPYLAYFAWRATSADTKLSVQVLHASEMHREVLTRAGWELLSKLQK